jgi:glutamyl-Q tRNA(Asp) synthetase
MPAPLATPSANHSSSPIYVGRFAPSPTGPLHFGSLISALASYLDARAQHGQWLLRIEDIDPPREQAGATAAILASLQAHGLHWDGEVMYQSQRLAIYRSAAATLVQTGRAFYCSCSRTQLAQQTCNCRQRRTPPNTPAAIRLSVPPTELCFDDAVQGRYCEQVAEVAGDFVVLRKEDNERAQQLPAYQLAVVIDDAEQGITHVVRGSDLLDNTARQILLQQHLALPTPCYAHLPVIANPQGQKLSKQTYARALVAADAVINLRAALDFLGQTPAPASLVNVRDLLDFAIAHWSLARVPQTHKLCDTELPPSCRPFAA